MFASAVFPLLPEELPLPVPAPSRGRLTFYAGQFLDIDFLAQRHSSCQLYDLRVRIVQLTCEGRNQMYNICQQIYSMVTVICDIPFTSWMFFLSLTETLSSSSSPDKSSFSSFLSFIVFFKSFINFFLPVTFFSCCCFCNTIVCSSVEISCAFFAS